MVTIQLVSSPLMNSTDQQVTHTPFILTRTTMGIKFTRRIRDSCLQGKSWAIEGKSAVGLKKYEKVWVNYIIQQHQCFQQKQKEEAQGGS